MEIVLGVSMTPTTVRMVLVEGDKADGVTVDHDVFDITAIDGAATLSASDQVIAAVLGTRESAVAAGHHLVSTGVSWSERAEAAVLREALTARGIEDVMLVSELHAAGALAQAIGRAVGYRTTALMFIERDTATLSVVETTDGSIVKVLSRSLHSDDAMAVLTEMAASLEAHESRPEGMFVVGSGVDVTSVKSHLKDLVSLAISAPEQPELALARGAALASANTPRFDASTVGLAYSQEPEDGTTAGAANPAGLAGAAAQLAAVGHDGASLDAADITPDSDDDQQGRKPFLLAGSLLTAIFAVGVVALVISLAVSIQPTVDQRPSPGDQAVVPSIVPPAPPAAQDAPPVQNAPAVQPAPVVPPPAATTIQAPVPVVQQAPQAPAVAPVDPPAAPAPVGAPPALFPAPIIQLPVPWLPPILQPPPYDPPAVKPPSYPIPEQPQPKWRKPGHRHD